MFNRKEAKAAARKNVFSDYVIFVIACLLAAYLGSAYGSTLTTIETSTPVSVVRAITSDAADPSVVDLIDVLTGSVANTKSLTADTVLTEIMLGRLEEGKISAEELFNKEKDSSSKFGIVEFGRTKGVLSGLINNAGSGKFLIMLFQTIMTVTKSKDITTAIFVVLAAAVMLGISIFIKDTYKVAFRRIFLEGHIYDHVKISRFLFLFRVKRFIKASYTIFLTTVYTFLWSFTIVGGIIKRYSYAMVPYIVAENPDINPHDAITLSRTMMYGHKWELFKLELTFFGWQLLGAVTLGLSQILFSNPYEECVKVAYYIYLRDLAKKNGISYADKMNDEYLYVVADDKLLKKTYADVIEIMNDDIVLENYIHTGFRGFIENNFGIIYKYDAEEDGFNEAIEQEEKIRDYKYILDGKQYPGRLFPIPIEKRDPRLEHVHYLRHYSIWTIIAMFFIFSFIGWSWEVALHLVTDGVFVNRGVNHGPWLPIYGSGGVMILILLYRFRKKPGLEATLTIILCGIVEYFTHWYLEITKGVEWWDYSGYFLNINGRICAEGLLVFMLGGVAIVYALGPVIDNQLRKINKKTLMVVCSVLLVIFACDLVYSSKHPNVGKGITDYNKETAQVERVDNIC